MENKPEKKGMSIWGKLGTGCGGLIVLIIIIAIVAGSKSGTAGFKAGLSQPSPEITATVESTPTQTPTPIYSFDIPSLIGKNIDQVRQTLGQPIQVTNPGSINTKLDSATLEPTQNDLNSQGDRDPWTNSWVKNNYELSVYYGYKSRQVESFNISLEDESPVSNEQVFLTVGNLNADGGSNYKIQFETCGSVIIQLTQCNSNNSNGVIDVQAIPK